LDALLFEFELFDLVDDEPSNMANKSTLFDDAAAIGADVAAVLVADGLDEISSNDKVLEVLGKIGAGVG
jgi:hypothetical protein